VERARLGVKQDHREQPGEVMVMVLMRQNVCMLTRPSPPGSSAGTEGRRPSKVVKRCSLYYLCGQDVGRLEGLKRHLRLEVGPHVDADVHSEVDVDQAGRVLGQDTCRAVSSPAGSSRPPGTRPEAWSPRRISSSHSPSPTSHRPTCPHVYSLT
jgi:hypothetical protein